ncbi:response regulator, partial [Candidatus Bathyarchaeota archaeon]|nr:response regulator [Candidatus Bathyarchaeota archaeon]
MVTPFKILVADDSAFMRKTICDLINEDPNLEVIGEATDGSEAITLARGFKPDIALLDILMPSMNGLEAMQVLLADSTMPIIILSSINPTNIDSSIQALMLGAADYIIKPTLKSSGDTSKFKEMLIKKIYDILKSSRRGFQQEREDESSTLRTFRQAAVDQVFAFGKYLNDVGKDKKRASPKEKNHVILKKPS